MNSSSRLCHQMKRATAEATEQQQQTMPSTMYRVVLLLPFELELLKLKLLFQPMTDVYTTSIFLSGFYRNSFTGTGLTPSKPMNFSCFLGHLFTGLHSKQPLLSVFFFLDW